MFYDALDQDLGIGMVNSPRGKLFYLPYEEPRITEILSLTSFLLLLNTVRYVFDNLLYCGLMGEILIGIIWGLPVGGTAWLSSGMQQSIQTFGYLGLIGLVFEGGLNTDLTLLRKTVITSISVATVGISVPIGLSFLLLVFPFESNFGTLYPTPLAGFSAGASLCSTSLGTTFAILSSASQQKTRTGAVIIGAAMMDDVVGLVMVNIVTSLGAGGTGDWPIARPITANFGMLIVTLVFTRFVLIPTCASVVALFQRSSAASSANATSGQRVIRFLSRIYSSPHLGFVLSTFLLVIYVNIAFFIDGSVLFAAFVAGGVVKSLWFEDGEDDNSSKRPYMMYDGYYKPVLDFVLVPFFFASIGFSIPIRNMFGSSIVWKGITYAALMVFAKAVTGLVLYAEHIGQIWRRQKTMGPLTESEEMFQIKGLPHADALLVGFAMVARGEIGFLIASLSQSSGTLMLKGRGQGILKGEEELAGIDVSQDLFLTIVWSVVLCTIVGPVAVGAIVRKHAGRNRQA